ASGSEALGAVAGDPTDLFAMLNDALAVDPVLIDVPAGVAVDEPIVVVSWTATDGALVAPRMVVRAADDAEVQVLEIQGSPDGVDALVVPVIELDAAPSARLGYASV